MFNTNYSMPTNLESIVSKQSDVEKALSTLNAAIDDKKIQCRRSPTLEGFRERGCQGSEHFHR